MLDAVTHERVLVRDTEFGPSILLNDYEDLDFLEDTFIEQHDIDTSQRELRAEEGQRRFELFIHSPLTLPEIQQLLDAMSYDTQTPSSDAEDHGTPTI